MSSLFDSWFGFIFWGVAYLRMRGADRRAGWGGGRGARDWLPTGANAALIAAGVFFLTAGTYASVQGIVDAFAAGAVGGVFSCASNAV